MCPVGMSQYNALFVTVFNTSFEIPSYKTLMLYKYYALYLRELTLHFLHPSAKDYSHNHISDIHKQTTHQSKQTPLHFYLPSTQLSSVPIKLSLARYIILQYPNFRTNIFLKCVNLDYRLRVVETFVFLAI